MDPNIVKALNDKLYDKRKSGALELESLIRECLALNDHDRIANIVHQLCHEYAYAVHQPHARNGGLIGLAAASIALGQETARYLSEIVPPVLACFSDQDARVRYYACESMYNIAKVAKGEILIYFNDIFDALSKLAADSEVSVKNGSELLDRLVKDIVSESAATYVSILQTPPSISSDIDSTKGELTPPETPTAFSLPRFIPLLTERINVINPFTRMFLVQWISLLDSIPDLELVTYLPSFLGGLFKFLSDPNQDVHTATQKVLDKFLAEIKRIARIKKGIAESRRSHDNDRPKRSPASDRSDQSPSSTSSVGDEADESIQQDDATPTAAPYEANGQDDGSIVESESNTANDEKTSSADDEWIPGQDVHIDYPKILEILVTFLSGSMEEEIQLRVLRWIDSFFEICPEDILPFVPRLLEQVLPAMSNDVEQVRQAANRVNTSLMEYIMSLPDEAGRPPPTIGPPPAQVQALLPSSARESPAPERRDSNFSHRPSRHGSRDLGVDTRPLEVKSAPDVQAVSVPEERAASPRPAVELDYEAATRALTMQFLNAHEATRVAALQWLIMLHKKAPRKLLAVNDETFPALLKTLSDPAEAVVTRDLLLLSQISKNSDDSYFTSFMVNLLKLFCTDRTLLEKRGNLIIRQLCVSLSAERIYRTLADCLEKDEDVEFASIMVQNLNNNLITAPELADLRKRLRNLDTRDGQTFFVTLFRSWCHNAVATFSLCLLAQAYEQAYNLLQIFADLEMTVNMLIQVDKLVQLLESPVFTYLRLQLLEPERYPHLYKCLYGILMLLPQSSAFAALKNRLNSVSAIGYLHTPLRTAPTTPATSSFERPGRLKSREEGAVRWVELLDKFKAAQEKARRAQRVAMMGDDAGPPVPEKEPSQAQAKQALQARPPSAASSARPAPQPAAGHKPKSSLSALGRFAGGAGGRKGKK